MAGNPLKCNQNLYCQYHQDQGHTTEDCRNLWDHLAQLVREGKLKQLLHDSSGQAGQTGLDPRRDSSSRPPLGTINVIFVAPGRTDSCPSRVMSVARLSTEDSNSEPKRARIKARLVLGFSANDKIGTIQSYNDALVVTLRIGGYNVKRLLVDQGSAIKIMYLDLYKGLNLKPEDLTTYDSPLTGSDVVEVDFIVVDAYSPYMAIMARPWLHALEAVSSTLHQKVKYPSNGQVKEIVGNQSMAR
ncbi:uncharacterized protein LOC115991132 [Quercus lobata]|uniref:uncharacterized protein LOC115991132 n=1 Tax=Quercus lobata TaxID=97700 RepID=UPI00124891C6|nr:uncharacterized protein LOC115991132 [Quercus lobata]